MRKRDRSFEFPELLLLLPHARVHYAVRILDASRIRSGSGYARREIVKLRGRGGGLQRRARSVGVVHHVRTRAFPVGVPAAPRIHPVIINVPNAADNATDNFLDNYGEEGGVVI